MDNRHSLRQQKGNAGALHPWCAAVTSKRCYISNLARVQVAKVQGLCITADVPEVSVESLCNEAHYRTMSFISHLQQLVTSPGPNVSFKPFSTSGVLVGIGTYQCIGCGDVRMSSGPRPVRSCGHLTPGRRSKRFDNSLGSASSIDRDYAWGQLVYGVLSWCTSTSLR